MASRNSSLHLVCFPSTFYGSWSMGSKEYGRHNGLPRWCSGKESVCQYGRHRRHRFDPWVRKNPLEEEMATHSSILAWKIPWTEESGELQSMGSQRVGHNWTHNTHKWYVTFKNRLLETLVWLLSCNLALSWVIHSGGSQMPCCEKPHEETHRAKTETFSSSHQGTKASTSSLSPS